MGKSRELLRVEDAAEELRMSSRHVRRLVQQRRLAFHRFGRWAWEVLGRSGVDDRTYAAAVAEAIATRDRWHREYDAAKAPGGTTRRSERKQFGNSATRKGERT